MGAAEPKTACPPQQPGGDGPAGRPAPRPLAVGGLALALLALTQAFEAPLTQAVRALPANGWLLFANHSFLNGQPPGLSDLIGLPFLALCLLYAASFYPPLARRLAGLAGGSVPALRGFAGFLAASGLMAAITVQTLKLAWARPRPNQVWEQGLDYTPFYLPGSLPPLHQWQTGSFPSGHTATVAVLAAIWLAWRAARSRPFHPSDLLLGPLLAASLGLMALSRVWAGDHWPTDVVAGAALGLWLPSWLFRLGGPVRAGFWANHPAARGGWAGRLVWLWLGGWLCLALAALSARGLGQADAGGRGWLELSLGLALGLGGMVYFGWRVRRQLLSSQP